MFFTFIHAGRSNNCEMMKVLEVFSLTRNALQSEESVEIRRESVEKMRKQ